MLERTLPRLIARMGCKRKLHSKEVKKTFKRRRSDRGVMISVDDKVLQHKRGGGGGERVCGKRSSSHFADDGGFHEDQLCKKLKESMFLSDQDFDGRIEANRSPEAKAEANSFLDEEDELCENLKKSASLADKYVAGEEVVQKISVSWVYMNFGEGVLDLITSALAARKRKLIFPACIFPSPILAT